MSRKENQSPITIVDLARMAGIHPSTVSRVFSGKAPVKPETANLVLELAEKHGFQINREARKLVRGQVSSKVIGIALPHLTHPFYTEILKGIQVYFEDRDINLMLFNLGRREDEVFERILEEGLAGLLVISRQFSPAQVERLRRAMIQAVFIDVEQPGAVSVVMDNRLGGEIAARHLLDRTTGPLLYVGEDFCSDQQDARQQGFSEEVAKQRSRAPLEIKVKQNRVTAQAEAEIFLAKLKPAGIFCYCDEIAYGVFEALRTLGLSVPLVGFDDLLPSQYLGLTTVAQPAVEMGRAGSQLLADLLAGLPVKKTVTVLEPTLQVRRT